MTTLEAYSKDMAEFTVLTREQEKTASPERLVLHNLRLVWKIASEFQCCGVPLEDLVNAGNLGLIAASRRYDTEKYDNIKFSTYAAWWIRQGIYNELHRMGHCVRFPENVWKEASKVNRGDIGDMSSVAIDRAEMTRHAPISLSKPAMPNKYNRSPSRAEILPDDAPSPYDKTVEARRRTFVDFCLSRLSTRDAEIMRRRFGIDGREPETLRSIAKSFDLSKERIRQIIKTAKTKLNLPSIRREGVEWI